MAYGFEWHGEPPQLNLFDYRKVPTGAFVIPERASNMAAKQFYTRQDVAEMFGNDVRTIDLWIRNGKLHAIKMGKRVYLEHDELWRDIAHHRLSIKRDELPESLKATG